MLSPSFMRLYTTTEGSFAYSNTPLQTTISKGEPTLGYIPELKSQNMVWSWIVTNHKVDSGIRLTNFFNDWLPDPISITDDPWGIKLAIIPFLFSQYFGDSLAIFFHRIVSFFNSRDLIATKQTFMLLLKKVRMLIPVLLFIVYSIDWLWVERNHFFEMHK